jgi:hypothetical protein
MNPIFVSMRRMTGIFLLLLMLLTTTECHQLFKLPVLVAHYQEHRQHDPAISFYSFLKLHYTPHQKDADHKRDEQLPFKDVNCVAFSFTTCECTHQHFQIISPLENRQVYSLYNETSKPQGASFDIFQPPRTV